MKFSNKIPPREPMYNEQRAEITVKVGNHEYSFVVTDTVLDSEHLTHEVKDSIFRYIEEAFRLKKGMLEGDEYIQI